MSNAGQPNRLTPAQAAARIGVSKITLYRMRSADKGPEYLRIGERIYYEPAKIAEWLEGQRRIPGQSSAKTSTEQRSAA